jgi:hypothetical protein
MSSIHPLSTSATVSIINSSSKGCILIAKKQFDRGDLIITQQPLIVHNQAEDTNSNQYVEQLSNKYNIQASIIYQAINVTKQPQSIQEKLLESYKPLKHKYLDEFIHDLTQEDVGRLCGADSCVSLQQFISFLLIYDANNHTINSNLTGVYPLLARCSHSCAVNCSNSLLYEYDPHNANHTNNHTDTNIDKNNAIIAKTQQNQRKTNNNLESEGYNNFTRCLRAIDTINAGTELCISYLSPSDLLKSTLFRNKKLRKQWLFECDCPRCRGIDQSRALRCDKCEKLGRKGEIYAWEYQNLLFFNNYSGEKPDSAVQQQQTRCKFFNTCSCQLSGAEIEAIISKEEEVCEHLEELLAKLAVTQQPEQQISQFWQRFSPVIAKNHWLNWEFLLTQRDLAILRRNYSKALSLNEEIIDFLHFALYKRRESKEMGDLQRVQALPANNFVLSSVGIAPPQDLSEVYMNWELGNAYCAAASSVELLISSGNTRKSQFYYNYWGYWLNLALAVYLVISGAAHQKVLSTRKKLQQWREEPACKEMKGKCAGCAGNSGSAVAKRCGRCSCVSYCSRECQLKDWKAIHKSQCRQRIHHQLDNLEQS